MQQNAGCDCFNKCAKYFQIKLFEGEIHSLMVFNNASVWLFLSFKNRTSLAGIDIQKRLNETLV